MKKRTIVFLVLIICIFSVSKALAESITYYVVQVGYYKNKAIMEKDVSFIAQQGLPIYKVAYNGGYRIFLGNYDSKEEAEKAAKRVNEMGFETLIRKMEKILIMLHIHRHRKKRLMKNLLIRHNKNSRFSLT